MAVIEIQGLVKDYRDRFFRRTKRALSGLQFSVGEGEFVALLGPNGAGKSTALRLIFDFIFPTEGSISVFGQPSGSAEWKARAGYMPEYFQPPKFLKGGKFLELVGAIHSMNNLAVRRRIETMSRLLDMGDMLGRKLGAYSRGMMQKIGLAQAMFGEPDLLVLDEPTANLDPSVRKRFKDLLEEEVSKGKTVLLSSHVLSEVEELATKVVFIKGGRVNTEGTIHDLLHPAEIYDIRFRGDRAAVAGFEERWELAADQVSGIFTLTVRGAEDKTLAVRKIVEAGGDIMHLAMRSKKLENVFVEIMEGGR